MGDIKIDKLKAELLAEEFPHLQIQYLISKGETGEMYCAIQSKTGRDVALKVLPIEYNDDEDRKRRFQREAQALSQLSHPNLVKLYDYGENEYFSWMILEWIEGRSLYKVNIQNGLQVNDALALVCKVCAVLSHAHDHGIVHRDVKPAHILINENGEVKLSNFGLSRETMGASNSLVSASGDKFGTAEYSAPEFWANGALIDHRADIFSLGVLLYEVLTGARPAGVFRMPSEIKPDLDPRLDEVIVRAMQELPDHRFQSCEAFMEAIQDVIDVPYEEKRFAMEPTAQAEEEGEVTVSHVFDAADDEESAPEEDKKERLLLVDIAMIVLVVVLLILLVVKMTS
ncbi:MAG: serine/threonine protein kinase [Akkermansiaceae bacterium]